jgi:hypothetical protein
MCLREVQQRTVATGISADLRTGQHCPNQAYCRGGESVAVGVNADDGIG